jgi:Tn3 transposase DDE domain
MFCHFLDSLLANHVAWQTEVLGANQHESHRVIDICYNNTSDIVPATITGDMHSINKANFAILCWFGMNLAPASPTCRRCGNTFTAAAIQRNTQTS